MGNLASELSVVHEGFRQRLVGIFSGWRDVLTAALGRAQESGRLRPDCDPPALAQVGVGAREGARRLGQVTPDLIPVMGSPTLQPVNLDGGRAVTPARVDRDAALVEALRRQEPGAAEALVAAYGDRVYRLAIRITSNEQDAEEVVQDALWTAARKIDTFKGESAFGSWLYRITANAAYQKLRSRQGRRQEISWEDLLPVFDEQGQHAAGAGDWSARVEEPALQTELRTVLTDAINDLPPDYRTAFLLHDVEGLSNPEIAETLHISLPAAKSRIHRSRLFLRQRLSEYLAAA
jgi:RNA polymerase sigma-70 factor (ECF subfamily)